VGVGLRCRENHTEKEVGMSQHKIARLAPAARRPAVFVVEGLPE